MERCYFSKEYTIMIWCNRVLSPIYLSLIIGAMVVIWNIVWVERTGIDLFLTFSLVLFLILSYSLVFEFYFTREYELTPEGICVRYANHFVKLYPWAAITQMCICSIHQAPRRNASTDVIWCTVGTINNGPPTPNCFWRSEFYGFFHLNSVIQIEYSDNRLNQFRRLTHQNIQDYRNK